MDLRDKNLESFLLKAEANPEIMEMLKGILFWCNAASEAGITLKEIASVGTVGYQIGQDPQLKEMLMYMIKLSEMGIGPEH